MRTYITNRADGPRGELAWVEFPPVMVRTDKFWVELTKAYTYVCNGSATAVMTGWGRIIKKDGTTSVRVIETHPRHIPEYARKALAKFVALQSNPLHDDNY